MDISVNNDYRQVLSYASIIDEFKGFKRNPMNTDIFDNPGTFYFKVMFYFNNPDEDNVNGFTSNLLGLDGDNTAYSYLINNGEEERASYMHDFICMLSNISSECPWFFKSIEGLDVAVDHSYLKDFKFEEVHSINIKCLQDTVDNRITTLLELYRAACFSHRWKKEIVPANLRKFDMGIYIFQAPYIGSHYTNINKDIVGWRSGEIANESDFANCKYFEFHNCEIDPNSIKTCYATVDNEKGFPMEPTITISYDDCYISSYNEELVNFIGDFVKIDIMSASTGDGNNSTLGSIGDFDKLLESISKDNLAHLSLRRIKQSNSSNQTITDILSPQRIKQSNSSNQTITNILTQDIKNKASSKVKSIIRKAALGNVYGFSISNALNIMNQANSGDLIGAGISAVKQGKNIFNSIKTGSVVSDTIPSIVGKNDLKQPAGKALGNIMKNIVRNL